MKRFSTFKHILILLAALFSSSVYAHPQGASESWVSYIAHVLSHEMQYILLIVTMLVIGIYYLKSNK